MRKPRIKLERPETFYHVMTRTSQCVSNLEITRDPQIKAICDRIIRQMAAIYHVEIYAWVLMDNHFHLCLSVNKPPMEEADIASRFESLQEINVHKREWYPWLLGKFYHRFCDLSWFMWEIKTRIARAFNQRHNTSGFFWGGRFKSKVIEDEAALLRVMTYIEQNPVRAGLCEKPSQFPFCSAGRAQDQLQQNQPTGIPAVGPFRVLHGHERARAYVDWMDYQADLILNPERRIGCPPKTIANFCLNRQILEEWRRDFQNGGPSNWSNQGYGSQSFEMEMREAEDARILELANQRYFVSRMKGTHCKPKASFSLNGSEPWWYQNQSNHSQHPKKD